MASRQSAKHAASFELLSTVRRPTSGKRARVDMLAAHDCEWITEAQQRFEKAPSLTDANESIPVIMNGIIRIYASRYGDERRWQLRGWLVGVCSLLSWLAVQIRKRQDARGGPHHGRDRRRDPKIGRAHV